MPIFALYKFQYFIIMFQLGKTIISEDILEKEFLCNLSACKGACCVDGDAGAPLSEAETKIMEEIYPKVKPFLRKEGIAAIEAQGTWVKGTDGDLETPLIDEKDCAYVIFDGKTALCGIEQAYNQGIVDWKKPVEDKRALNLSADTSSSLPLALRISYFSRSKLIFLVAAS